MQQRCVAPWIRQEDYLAMKAVCPDDNLPASFDQWQELATNEVAELEAKGITVVKVIIDPQELCRWCTAKGIHPNLAGRAAFASYKDIWEELRRDIRAPLA